MQEAILKATAWITGTVDAGKVVFVRNQNGDPTAIKIVSTTKPEGAEHYPMWIISAGGIGYSTDGGATISNIGLTADGHIVADTINLNTANVSGKLSADRIDVDNLKVKAANVTGTIQANQIDADNLKVKAANVTGTIQASQIAVDDITIGSGQVDGTFSANKIKGGEINAESIDVINLKAQNLTSGYVPSARLSSEGHRIDNLYVSDGAINNLNTTTIKGTEKIYLKTGAIIGGTSVSVGDTSATWTDIIAIANAGSTARFG